jgi:hypothetical protein
VTVQPLAPLLPGVSYTLSVNPVGVTSPVSDQAGNAAATTARSFTL